LPTTENTSVANTVSIDHEGEDVLKSDIEILVKILMGKQYSEVMNPYQKFSDVSPFNILEENLLIAQDGTEIIFKVINEQDQPQQANYITIDLSAKEIKFWNNIIGDIVMNYMNPYSMKSLKKQRMDFNSLPQCLITKIFTIKSIQNIRRSQLDNRYLILTMITSNLDGRPVT
jgi:hypothetical protein